MGKSVRGRKGSKKQLDKLELEASLNAAYLLYKYKKPVLFNTSAFNGTMSKNTVEGIEAEAICRFIFKTMDYHCVQKNLTMGCWTFFT